MVGMQRIMDEILAGAADTRRHVWACTEPQILERLDLDQVPGHVVVVSVGPNLLSEGASFYKYEPGRLERLAERLGSFVRGNTRALHLRMNDDQVFSDDQIDRDALSMTPRGI